MTRGRPSPTMTTTPMTRQATQDSAEGVVVVARVLLEEAGRCERGTASGGTVSRASHPAPAVVPEAFNPTAPPETPFYESR
ncbi:hypothetical protein E2C01_048113 [Portunus trituberculatus]|uniref:Uncharacterized protein n=1 Tax=Portunus trituberculatus TaxID=210409 RepID=A0A5B7G9U6_PORTR|nr:hypothetical protein [Portunus trituberculatus]